MLMPMKRLIGITVLVLWFAGCIFGGLFLLDRMNRLHRENEALKRLLPEIVLANTTVKDRIRVILSDFGVRLSKVEDRQTAWQRTIQPQQLATKPGG